MRRIVEGQLVMVSGRRMLVVRVETIDEITHVWVRREVVLKEMA